MSFIERCIHQPVAVAVVVLLVLLFGMIGLFRVPVQLTPNVDQPVISVTTRWFGASPQEIAYEILQQQEEVLKTLNGLRELSSEATEGEGTVRLEFYVGVDKEAALNEVRDKLTQVPSYPFDVERPVIESVDSSSRDYLAWMLIRPKDGNPEHLKPGTGFNGEVITLQNYVEDFVKPELQRAEGVASVQVLGGREREMQVRVDLEKLAARGITLDALVNALRQENLNVSAGGVPQGKREVSVRAIGQYADAEHIRQTVISWTSAGVPIYVSDVAEVGIGYKRQVAFVRSGGQEVLALNAKRQVGTNVMEVMENLKRQIARVNRDILAPRGWGLELQQVYDQTIYVRRAVQQAADDLLLGAVLAALVLFLTLRSLGATVVVSLSIIISIIGTFLGMALTGRNLNVISMAGLSFAIGMGVDNTIVVLENIFRHREMGKDRRQAAIDGAQEVWGAILAATLANIAVFLPVVFIREEAGQLFQDISVAISLSLLLYLFISPTVIPVLATLFLRKLPRGFEAEGRPEATLSAGTRLAGFTQPLARLGQGLATAFYSMVLWLTGGYVRRAVLVVVMIGLALLGSWALIPPQTYLPGGNQNLVFAILVPPPGYGIDTFRQMGEGVENTLRPWWQARLGSPELAQLQQRWLQTRDQVVLPAMEQQLQGMQAAMPPEVYASASRQLRAQRDELRRSPAPAAIENFFFVAYQGGVFMGATSTDGENVASLKYLLNEATQGIPGTFAIAIQASIFDVGDSFGSSVEMNISGPHYEQVRQAAAATQGLVMQQLSLFAVPNPQNFALGREETQITPDRIRAAAAGVATASIRRAAQVAVDGEVIGNYREGAKAIDLTVLTPARVPGHVEALRDVPLATRDGRIVTLASVAHFVQTEAPQRIRRIEEQPAITLSLQLPPNLTVQEMEAALWSGVIEPLKQQGVITPELTVRTSGSAAKLGQFMRAFLPGFLLAAAITYLLLAALFESWLHPFVIIMSVPFALVGGFGGLWLLHQTSGALLDVLTMLGFVILVGTIVNNPILIVYQALHYMRDGMDRQHAIALSTQTRVRPIFMSVLISVAGMAPLVLLGGAGSELYRGLGAVVIGGLLVSTVFTLVLTPTLMSLVLDLQAAITAYFVRDAAAPLATTAAAGAPAEDVASPPRP
ncbi:MAG: efflux RND transporter permease subunit [Candidatus Tectimicrobiota bacterium]